MHNIKYEDFMRSLGLSTHPAQCARRMQKYPAHFKAKNNQVYISVDYALFVIAKRELAQVQQKLKGEHVGRWWQSKAKKEVQHGN